MTGANALLFLWHSRQEREEFVQDYLRGFENRVLDPKGISKGVLGLFPGQAGRKQMRDLEAVMPFPSAMGKLHFQTIHSFCMKLLNKEGFRVGVGSSWEVIPGWHEFLLLKALLPTLTLRGYQKGLTEKDGFVRLLLRHFDYLLANNITPADFTAELTNLQSLRLQDLARIYAAYNGFCHQEGYLSLAALAPAALRLLVTAPNLVGQAVEGYQLLLVDDLDQLEPVQLELVSQLLRFFPKTLLLAPVAARIIPLAKKQGWQILTGSGKQPLISKQEYKTADEEAWAVASEVAWLISATGVKPHEINVFFTHSSLRPQLGRALAAMGIPHQQGDDEGPDPVWQFLMAYLAALQEPAANELHFRWLNAPVLELEGINLPRLYYHAQGQRFNLLHLLLNEAGELGSVGVKACSLVKSFLHRQQALAAGKLTPLEVLEELCHEHRLFPRYLAQIGIPGDRGETARQILENLRDFLCLVREYHRLYKLFVGSPPGLTEFLRQLQGARPYLKAGVTINGNQLGGVAVVPLKDAPLYSPRVAFLVGLAHELFPERRVWETALDPQEWQELKTLFPALVLPHQLETTSFLEEQQAVLNRSVICAREKVKVSWAGCYGDTLTTGVSALLEKIPAEIVEARKDEIGANSDFLWPDPAPGVHSAVRLTNFYLSRVQHVAGENMQRERKKIEKWGFKLGWKELSSESRAGGEYVPVQIKYFTPAAVNSYLACPRRFFYQYLLRLDIPSQPAAYFGRLLHTVLEKFHRQYPSLTGVNEEIAWEYLARLLETAWAEMKDALGKGLLAQFYRWQGEAICRAYLKQELLTWREDQTAEVERSLDFMLGPYRLRGRLDRFDRFADSGGAIIDYKTGWDRTAGQRKREFLPLPEKSPEDMQLIIYYLGAKEQGLPVNCLTWYQLSQLPVPGGVGKRTLPVDTEGKDSLSISELKQAAEHLQSVLCQMETGYYPPVPRDRRICSYCSFQFPCPGSEDGEEADGDD